MCQGFANNGERHQQPYHIAHWHNRMARKHHGDGDDSPASLCTSRCHANVLRDLQVRVRLRNRALASPGTSKSGEGGLSQASKAGVTPFELVTLFPFCDRLPDVTAKQAEADIGMQARWG